MGHAPEPQRTVPGSFNEQNIELQSAVPQRNINSTGFQNGVGKDQVIVTSGNKARYFGLPKKNGS